jgi:mannose-1-phosphate guanylyltransferase
MEFLESGDFFWNAGIFIWNVQTLITALRKYTPNLAATFSDLTPNYYTPQESRIVEAAYSQCHTISIDYALMEKADNVYVVLCNLGWSDLGTWKSIYEVAYKNRQQNVLSDTVLAYETTNTIVKTSGDKMIVVQGLENYIVVENENVVLICHKDQEQRIKEFLDDAKKIQHGRFC